MFNTDREEEKQNSPSDDRQYIKLSFFLFFEKLFFLFLFSFQSS